MAAEETVGAPGSGRCRDWAGHVIVCGLNDVALRMTEARALLDECWRPAFARYLYPRYTGPKRELDTYLRFYNTDRVHHGRLTQGRIPADIVYGARKMEAR